MQRTETTPNINSSRDSLFRKNKPLTVERKIIAFSIDYDGCLFHYGVYGKPESDNPIITQNKLIIDIIAGIISGSRFAQIYFQVGSNRQSKGVDLSNSIRNKSGSCYAAILKFCDEFCQSYPDSNISVDRFLLSDAFGEVPAGENFSDSVNQRHMYFHDYFFDVSKLTLLYAQMHKLASENEDSEVQYHFFDDLYYQDDPDDILNHLRIFFGKHAYMIPNNVTLHLHFYNGEEYDHINTVNGTGEIDHNYRNNIKHMAECGGLNYREGYNARNNVMASLHENDGLNKFIETRLLRQNAMSPKPNK